MELKKDLLKKDRKSTFRIILGILSLILSIVWIIEKSNHGITGFDWFYAGSFALSGVYQIIDEFGLSPGKAFIFIDKDIISIKSGIFDKEQSIVWNDIKSIHYKNNCFEFFRSNNSSMTYNIKSLGYSLIKDIKQVIRGIASEKGIAIDG